jgi:sulfonate transport system substrate-binding protein
MDPALQPGSDMTKHKSIIGHSFAAALLLMTSGAQAASLPANAPLPDAVPPGTVLVVGGPTVQTAFRLSGELQKLPFKVVFTTFSGGPAVLDAFRAKALDIGSGNDIPAIHETFLGFDIRIIAVARRHNLPNPVQFGIAPGSNIASLANLRGKKIAYSAGQAQGSIVLRTLKHYGIRKNEVQLVPLPSRNDVYVNALAAHLVDAAPLGATVFSKHFIDNYAKDGAKLLAPEGVTENPINLWVRTETLQDPGKAAAIKYYLKAYIRAQHWVDHHRKEWIENYYIKDQGLSRDDAEYLTRNSGEMELLGNWDQSIRDEQDTVNFMAAETAQKPFDARRIFDRRFEQVAAKAASDASSKGK